MNNDDIELLASGLAHEIKNPLNAMKLHIALCKKYIDTNSLQKVKEKANIIEAEINRINILLTDFLRFARSQKLSKHIVLCQDIVSNIIKFIEPECLINDIKLEYNIEGQIPPIEGDPELLKQVILNLILNAIEAVKNKSEEKCICVNLYKKRNNIAIEIKDNGKGISKKLRTKIFEPFFSTSEIGTGLGLALTQKIITAHKGKIILKSKENKGSKFIILLPLKQ